MRYLSSDPVIPAFPLKWQSECWIAPARGAFTCARLGAVYAAETGFWIEADPDTVRAPDVAFVSNARLPEDDPDGYARFVPDLVVEVLSPSDRADKVREKVRDWLAAGVRLVWVVHPKEKSVRVYREDSSESTVAGDQALDAEPVLPGFRCSLDEVFRR